MLLSMSLGMLGVLHKASSVLWKLRHNPNGIRFVLISYVPAFLMVLWTAAKLYFSFACDSHLWNLSDASPWNLAAGCVPEEALL
mmetsp:Transcript_13112/g.33804  ORF Transcript_13112/g.33804 Transcript_13112/m.33804 type:complete len:84 (+) Transcript_13112:1374-1625(+)